ncbi:hypothetical protein ACFLXL_01845 [Chloroflexota bacterium]
MSEWQPEEYSEQEMLSMDRLKRAVVSRVRKKAEAMTGAGEEYLLGQDKTAQIIKEEWARAKQAVKASKAAKENLQKDWDAFVDTEVNRLVKSEKGELSSMGIPEKSI